MTPEHSLSATPNRNASPPSLKRTCKKCQRESRRRDKFCTGCGADLGELSLPPLLISAGLTVAPFIITPIFLVSSVDDGDAYESFGSEYIAIFVYIAFLLAVYGVGVWIVREFVRRRYRSVAHGMLLGLWTGPLLAVASYTASFAAT